MPKVRTSDGCRQHHGECEPWDRHGHTIRARDDDWKEAQDAHGQDEIAGYIAETMQARRGIVRCWRCHPGSPPVPVIPGDLTGKPLDEWISAAVRRAESQHPRHEPVWLGRESPIRADAVCARCDAPWSPRHVCDADHQKLVHDASGGTPAITTVPEVPVRV